MSINVTVTGNPVCVRRGKMVTTGAMGEFDRRRLVRLEQVRQQSRDIAEGVREKVRKEKRKQLGELEEEGREKLRRSQNRRLLELQTQYREGMRELGIGHREAEKENDREHRLSQKREAEHRNAVRRGNEAAAALLQPKKRPPEGPKEASIKQTGTRPIVKSTTTKNHTKKKKIAPPTTRHIPKKRRGASADININIPGTDSDDEGCEKSSVSEDLSSSDKTEAASDVESSEASPRRPPEATPVEQCSGPSLTPVEESPTSVSRDSDRQPRSPVKSTGLKKFLQDLAGPPDIPDPDTRISERIRKRVLVPVESEQVLDKKQCSCEKFMQEFSQGTSNLSSRDIQKPIDYTQGRCRCDSGLQSKSVQVQEEKVHRPVGSVPQASSVYVPGHRERCPCGKSGQVRSKSVQVHEEKSPAPEGSSKDLPGSETVQRRCPCDKTLEVKSRSVQVQVEEERGDLPDLPEVNLRTSSETFKSGSGTSKVQFYDHASRTCTERHVPIDSYLERNVPGPREALPRDPSVCCDNAKRQRDAKARFQRALEQDRISKDYEEMLKRLPLLERRERVAGITRDRPGHHMAEGRAKEEERRRQNAMENEFARAFPRHEAIVTVPKRGTGAAGGPGTWDEERPQTAVPKDYRTSLEKEGSLAEPKIFTANEVQDIVKAFTGRNVDERRRKLRELLESLKLQKEELVREIRKIPADDSVNDLIRDLDSVVRDDKEGKKKRSRRRKEAEDSSSSSSEVRAKGRKERRRDSAKVLQTVSTQTSDRKICTEVHVPCDCKPELCEILIQVADNKEVKVSKPDDEPPPKAPPDDKPAVVAPEKRSVAVGTDWTSRERTSSLGKWHDSLGKNSFSTTSTSYLSPPDFKKFTGLTGNGKKAHLVSLVPYIERLLGMSRASVDELSVSTVSSVATPSQSVVDVAANNPGVNRLEELIKYFAAKTAEVPHALSVSPDNLVAPPNSSEDSKPPSLDSRESLMKQYADITESCSKRIENLAAMIQKLRDEKEEMLGRAGDCACEGDGNSRTDRSMSSVDEEEMFRKVTEIDMKLAEKLKGVQELKRDAMDTVKRMVDPDSSNAEMVSRLERLRRPPEAPPSSSSAFVPFLSDIPKLPKFEPLPNNNQHRRPPPSKGLTAVKNLVDDVDKPLVPHELSTIPEADSQASRLGRSLEDIPEEPQKAASTSTSSDSFENVLRTIGMDWAIPTLHKTKEAMALAGTSTSSGSRSDRFVGLLTNSSDGSSELSKSATRAPLRTSTPLTSSKSPSMVFSDSSSISLVKRSSNDS